MSDDGIIGDKFVELLETSVRTEEKIVALDRRINGTLLAIDKHINHGHVWRTAIAGLSLTVVVNIVVFAYIFGKQTGILEELKDKIEEHVRVEREWYREPPIILN